MKKPSDNGKKITAAKVIAGVAATAFLTSAAGAAAGVVATGLFATGLFATGFFTVTVIINSPPFLKIGSHFLQTVFIKSLY